ncbi:MAG: YggT family protein [Firmicutes bacterium]|nr:YggT family protein [Bacillota bacterium]
MSISPADVVYYAIQVYIYIIIIRIILSLVRFNPFQPGLRFIFEITEPVLRFFRRYIPPMGMFDFSPVAAILFLEIIQMLLRQYWH